MIYVLLYLYNIFAIIMRPRPIDNQRYIVEKRYRNFIREYMSTGSNTLHLRHYRSNPNRIPAAYYSMFCDILVDQEREIFTQVNAESIFYEIMQQEEDRL